MKRLSKYFSIGLVALLIAAATLLYFTYFSKQGHDHPAPSGKELKKAKYYKSTMLPGEVRSTPGKDSMGMEMVPVYEDQSSESAAIAIDPTTTQNMGIRTVCVTNGPVRKIVRTVGVIDINEKLITDVTTKFQGWIERLYANATGMYVQRGKPLFEIYSPEVYSAEVEYLSALELARRAAPGAEQLKASALTKLRYFDISDRQIAELENTNQPKKALQIDAPRDGFIIEKMVVEGQMVEAGMKLFRIADLSRVWAMTQIYEQDLPYIKVGQSAVMQMAYEPNRLFPGHVDYIYPTVDEKTRTATVRLEFDNPDVYLKPGMYATIELTTQLMPDALLIPESAILRSGEKNTVFVALANGKFEPREVKLGTRVENDMYQVVSGLKKGEQVVVSGQFMLDSESQLREALQKMIPK